MKRDELLSLLRSTSSPTHRERAALQFLEGQDGEDYREDRVVLFYDRNGDEVTRLDAYEAVPGGKLELTAKRRIHSVEILAAKDVYE